MRSARRVYHVVLDTGMLATSKSLPAAKRYAEEHARSEFAVFRERATQPNVWQAIGGVRRARATPAATTRRGGAARRTRKATAG